MIHHSNPICDTCGERHSDGNIEECCEILSAELAELKVEYARLEKAIEDIQQSSNRRC